MLQEYWKSFLRDTKRDDCVKCAGTICFGMNAEACEKAVEKILLEEMCCRIYPANGYRKAMSGEAKAGDVNIVVDWRGTPRAVIETTHVKFLQVSELSDDICAGEGVCTNLAEWMEKQQPAIKLEVEELGGEFDGYTLLCVEEFKKIYPLV